MSPGGARQVVAMAPLTPDPACCGTDELHPCRRRVGYDGPSEGATKHGSWTSRAWSRPRATAIPCVPLGGRPGASRTPPRQISTLLVGRTLREMGYALHANPKTLEGKDTPHRDEHGQHVHDRVREFQSQSQHVICVDWKRDPARQGIRASRTRLPVIRPARVTVQDCQDDQLCKIAPCGVHDPVRKEAGSMPQATATPPPSQSPPSAAGGRSWRARPAQAFKNG